MNNDKVKYIVSHVAVSILTVTAFVAVGWIGRGVLEMYLDSWRNLQFTLQMAVPVLIAAVFLATLNYWLKPWWLRVLVVLGVFGALMAWFSTLTQPFDYNWLDGLPAVGLLLLVVFGGVSILAWLKPHLASWPWWK